MWKEGTILIGGKGYRYWVKHYEEGSQFGIDGGRISKLMIKRGGEIVALHLQIAPMDQGVDIFGGALQGFGAGGQSVVGFALFIIDARQIRPRQSVRFIRFCGGLINGNRFLAALQSEQRVAFSD